VERVLGEPVMVKPSYSVMGVAFTRAEVKACPTTTNWRWTQITKKKLTWGPKPVHLFSRSTFLKVHLWHNLKHVGNGDARLGRREYENYSGKACSLFNLIQGWGLAESSKWMVCRNQRWHVTTQQKSKKKKRLAHSFFSMSAHDCSANIKKLMQTEK
jgi:hypothetical protein